MNRQSVGRRTRERPGGTTSLRPKGEVQTRADPTRSERKAQGRLTGRGGTGGGEAAGTGGKPSRLKGSVRKPRWGPPGGRRRNGRKAGYVNRGDLLPGVRAVGVRASVVAAKPGNAGGAKGRREVDG